MLYIVIICVVFVVVVLFVRYRQLSLPTPMATPKRKRVEDENAALFHAASQFLSNEEKTLYKALRQTVNRQANVMAKVHISELATPSRSNSAHSAQRSKNTVQNSHFDFVVCSNEELEPLCAVEISRRGLTRARGLAEKNFKLQVSAAIDLPIVFVEESNDYSVAELRSEINPYLPRVESSASKPPSIPTAPKAPVATQPKTVKSQPVATPKPAKRPPNKPKALRKPVAKPVAQPTPVKRPSKKPATAAGTRCPKCNGPMSVKVAKKGEQTGKKFRVCNNFSNCRTALPL